jgi:hypothetical protein
MKTKAKTKAKPLSRKAMKKTKGGFTAAEWTAPNIKGETLNTLHKEQIDVLSTAATGKFLK